MPLSQSVATIMTVAPVVANQFHNFSQVLRLFTEFPVHHLPVVDSQNKLMGIISSNDLPKVFLTLCTNGNATQMDLEAIDKAINLTGIMTRNPITIAPGDTIAAAVKIFAEKQFLALPVVDKGELVGIVSVKDVMAHLARKPIVFTTED